ncbi:MAG TPA: ABC-2 family transporter protein [Aggregatilinea sp.]|uniref:ABC transporter permease n=1 Tax=Aggregatilinea sp. TaxID=2806333 RepID=UPI002C42EEF2|nr:ABC-2 family transporter protein [Aggregatilinea sp.]HML24863.1 ABC-2 family transporter protein [Aggregatilinea sp.]
MSAISAPQQRGQPRAQIDKYAAIMRINVQNSVAYIWDAAGQGVFIVLFIFIFSQLWHATFAAQDATVIGGLTLNQTLWYFVWAELIELSKIRVSFTIQDEVKDGSLAYTLGRPYNYVLYHLFSGLGSVGIRMISVLVFGAVIALTQVGPLHTFRIETLPAVLLVTLFAFLIDYCFSAGIGLLAFFFEDTSAFRLIYQKINFVLGGLLLPVDFLPGAVQTVARVLPFNLILYGPSKLFVAWDSTQFVQILGLQIVWLAILGSGVAVLFRYGARRVSINGG